MKMINYHRPASFTRPAVNIIETEDKFELELLAPGREKEFFNVDLYDGVLEITYTTEKTGEETEPEYRRREFALGDFTRRFKLDDKVINDGKIDATYTNGILRLTLPKREEAVKTTRQIAVA